MGILATIEADASAAGKFVAQEAGVMVADAEHFFGALEGEVSDVLAPYVAKIRGAFADELGYLADKAWSDVVALVKSKVALLATNYPNAPLTLIQEVLKAVLAALPAELSALEQLALHGLVSACVAAIMA